MSPSPSPYPLRRDLAITAGCLLLLLAWDFTGLDLAAARLFGTPAGFAARDTFWASRVLHDGGRIAAWVLMALLVSLWGLKETKGGEWAR